MGWVKLVGVEIFGHHGVTREEQNIGQKFRIDVEMQLDLAVAGKSDYVKDTVDYAEVYKTVESITRGRRYHLIEAMAEDISSALLAQFAQLRSVRIRVKKPGAAIGGILDHAEVEIHRGRSTGSAT